MYKCLSCFQDVCLASEHSVRGSDGNSAYSLSTHYLACLILYRFSPPPLPHQDFNSTTLFQRPLLPFFHHYPANFFSHFTNHLTINFSAEISFLHLFVLLYLLSTSIVSYLLSFLYSYFSFLISFPSCAISPSLAIFSSYLHQIHAFSCLFYTKLTEERNRADGHKLVRSLSTTTRTHTQYTRAHTQYTRTHTQHAQSAQPRSSLL